MKKVIFLSLCAVHIGLIARVPKVQKPRDILFKNIEDSEKPITVFSHGLGVDYNHAVDYINHMCSSNYISFNYPDAPEGVSLWRHRNTGLAQTSEIKCLQRNLERIYKEHPRSIVLYGVSRGASTIINAIGDYARRNRHFKYDIKALILESPFAHCRDAVEWAAKNAKVSVSLAGMGARFIFKEYDEKKNAPQDLARHIPRSMPILLICSREDQIVPACSTQMLYKVLRDSGHKNCYILDLPYGIHANILWGACGHIYQTVLHAFYRSAGLPHDVQLANKGQSCFELCQPVIP